MKHRVSREEDITKIKVKIKYRLIDLKKINEMNS